MADVDNLEFSKFKSFFVKRSLSPRYSASLCEISLKSDNRLLSYGQKTIRTVNGRRPPSSILKIFIFGHLAVIEFQICCYVTNVIKIGWFSVDIWQFHDFQDGGSPPSWILWVQQWALWKANVRLYRSLIETIALNCLVFEKIVIVRILATDRRTDRRTDG